MFLVEAKPPRMFELASQQEAIPLDSKAQAGLFFIACEGIGRHRVGTDLKGEIAGHQEREQGRGNGMAALFLNDGTKEVDVSSGQAELDSGSGNIPRDVLTADKVMRCAMIEGIGLDQPIIDQKPLPGLHAVIGEDTTDMPAEIIYAWQGLIKNGCRLLS